MQKPALPHWKEIAKKGRRDYTGGVSNGEYGAAAFDFSSPHDSLSARKSWFFFDREYVCLGTAIHSEADYPVATTINQCLLQNKVVVKTKNGTQTLDSGQHQLNDVSWVMHDSIAYLFPAPVSVNISNVTTTGNWRQITHQAWATNATVQKDLFTLWLNHGLKPNAASYAYIVIPSITASAVEPYSRKADIVILTNTAEMQAVQNKRLQVSQVVFYQPGTIILSPGIRLTAKSPCMVMIRMNGNRVERLSVSDPTQKLQSLQFQINTPIKATSNNWRSTWNKETASSVIEVDLPTEGEAGKSVVLEMKSKKNN
jgi:chondroitin AC lyase